MFFTGATEIDEGSTKGLEDQLASTGWRKTGAGRINDSAKIEIMSIRQRMVEILPMLEVLLALFCQLMIEGIVALDQSVDVCLYGGNDEQFNVGEIKLKGDVCDDECGAKDRILLWKQGRGNCVKCMSDFEVCEIMLRRKLDENGDIEIEIEWLKGE